MKLTSLSVVDVNVQRRIRDPRHDPVPPDPIAVDWETFTADFVGALASVLGTAAENVPWPELHEDEVSGLTDQYSSPEWVESR